MTDDPHLNPATISDQDRVTVATDKPAGRRVTLPLLLLVVSAAALLTLCLIFAFSR